MGIHLEVIDHSKEFRQISDAGARRLTIINDLQAFSEGDKDELNKLIYTTFSSEPLTNIPSCDCGETAGAYFLNELCHRCGTKVQAILDQQLESLLWVRKPNDVEALVNPAFWSMLNDEFKLGQFSFIQWLCDTTYYGGSAQNGLSNSVKVILASIDQAGIQRGYNNFVRNFHDIIDKLYRIKQFKPKEGEVNQLRELINMYPNAIFCDHLPIPHRCLLVIEETAVAIYRDKIIIDAIDAIRTLTGIDTEQSIHSVRVKENRTVKTLNGLNFFFKDTYKDTLASKKGVFRKNVFACRCHFAFRAVVSSITRAHDYRQIEIPWSIGTTIFRYHLANKLFTMGFTPNEVFDRINAAANTFDPLLDLLFKELIAEAPSGLGINCTINRNPSLGRGSIQSVYIGKVKTDVADPTIGISILIVRSMNCDFDGRQALPSLNFLNCWKSLRAESATIRSKELMNA